MSGTDKTRPWAVKCLDDPSWLEADHDHREGPCDLPARPTKTANPFGETGARCTWVATREFWSLRANGCGCRSCTDQFGRRVERRRARHRAQREKTVEQRHLTARAQHGQPIVDDLTDVPGLWEDLDMGFGGFHTDVAWFSAVRDRIGLPTTSLIVDIDHGYGHRDAQITSTRIEVLHNDGRREIIERRGGIRDLLATRPVEATA